MERFCLSTSCGVGGYIKMRLVTGCSWREEYIVRSQQCRDT